MAKLRMTRKYKVLIMIWPFLLVSRCFFSLLSGGNTDQSYINRHTIHCIEPKIKCLFAHFLSSIFSQSFLCELLLFVEPTNKEILKRKNDGELEHGEQEKPPLNVRNSKVDLQIKKILASYHELWPCLVWSEKGEAFAKCTVCNSHFSCAHSGRQDCKRHIESKQHQDFLKMKLSNRYIRQKKKVWLR